MVSDEIQSDFYIIVCEYNGHYKNSTFTSRQGETGGITQYLLKENATKEQGNPYAEHMLYNIQKNKTHFAAASSIRLIESMAEMLQQRREQDENQKHKYRIL